MPHVDYVDPEDADERTRDILEADADYYGRPSLFARAMASDPGAFAARREYHRRLVDGGPLATRTCELVYLAVSVTNDCEYCVASHRAALVEQVGVDETTVDALARGDTAQFDERECAAISFAEQVAADPSAVTATHLDALQDAGFDDAAIVGLLGVAATAVSANTIADALDVQPAD
jgi:uncharacterized peroxidase-related enzyme